MTERLDFLHPLPQEIRFLENTLDISKFKTIFNIKCSNPRLKEKYLKKLNDLGFCDNFVQEGISNGIDIIIDLAPNLNRYKQGYKLIIKTKEIKILANDEPGCFYGILTFFQILKSYETNKDTIKIPQLMITDYPDFITRGIMLDVSRNKVPSMETLSNLIDLLSSWKINHIQLYFEHVFAYEGHEVVWKNASPFSSSEIKTLNKLCQENYIELVPNQNSFGHFHRWLIHEEYRDLAECPDGYDHPFSTAKEPFSLNPTDSRSLALLEDLYAQLLPNFTSNLFNVGLDETFDLGEGRSAELCQEKRKEFVYLDYLLNIYRLAKKFDKTILFWADMIFKEEEVIPLVPRDAIPLLWGYEADHPFKFQTEKLRELGFSFYVCPGTSSWNSFSGRTVNAIENLINAAAYGKNGGSVGFLITDWGDHGHLQPLPISYLGFMVGSGLAWNTSNITIYNYRIANYVIKLLDMHLFASNASKLGSILYDIGTIHSLLGYNPPNSSGLFLTLMFPFRNDSIIVLESCTINQLQAIKTKVLNIRKELLGKKDESLEILELIWVTDVLVISCNLNIARITFGIDVPLHHLPNQTITLIIKELSFAIKRLRELWLKRNRIGGLNDSCQQFEKIIQLLETK